MKYCKSWYSVLLVVFASIIIITISIQIVLSRQAKLRSNSLRNHESHKSRNFLCHEKFGRQQKFPGRYVIAESYWEQMTRATINIYDLIKFATEWQASVPIPFLVKSFPRGFPSIKGNRSNEPSFSFLFDMYEVQRNLISKNLNQFVDFDQFLLNFKYLYYNMYNTTFVVTIEFVSCKGNIEGSGSNFYHVSKVPCILEYKTIIRHLYKASRGTFSNFEEHWSLYGSSLTCCNVCGIIPTLSSDISIGCGFHGLSKFTVIFKQWRGLSLPLLYGSFRLFAPTNYLECYRAPSPALPHSSFIKSKAIEFLNHCLIGNERFVAVHIRTEKIHIAEKKMKINGTKCVLSAITTARIVSQVTGIRHIMFFTDNFALDYYGDVFRAQNVKITSYDPKTFHLQPESDGIVAQIEQNIASRATVLVLSGGGSFQYVIKRRYSKNVARSKRLVYELSCR